MRMAGTYPPIITDLDSYRRCNGGHREFPLEGVMGLIGSVSACSVLEVSLHMMVVGSPDCQWPCSGLQSYEGSQTLGVRVRLELIDAALFPLRTELLLLYQHDTRKCYERTTRIVWQLFLGKLPLRASYKESTQLESRLCTSRQS